MRYAIFTDIHANLEALDAVLAKIDELAQEEPIDQIWFLGDLVGYGPNPNECIAKLRERTDVIIAGNHDWAAVGKIDLEDFSEAARISAQWTADQLTEEHREFLANLPERLEIGECLLVHGSPYGPLWEYLTSEVLAERSFQHFSSRFCFVGHTHVPVIFIQPDTVANAPTIPLKIGDEIADLAETEETEEQIETIVDDDDDDDDEHAQEEQEQIYDDEETQRLGNDDEETQKLTSEAETAESLAASDRSTQEESEESDTGINEETTKIVAVRSTLQTTMAAAQEQGAVTEPEALQHIVANAADVVAEIQQHIADDAGGTSPATLPAEAEETTEAVPEQPAIDVEEESETKEDDVEEEGESANENTEENITPEEAILNAEERLNEEIEELLALLGLSQSMISVTNEMLIPPEGTWKTPEGYRAIVNPGGVGQPRDGDSRAAFMIYDTKGGFTFYRISYDIEKTQEKIIKARLPQYLATRLAYGR